MEETQLNQKRQDWLDLEERVCSDPRNFRPLLASMLHRIVVFRDGPVQFKAENSDSVYTSPDMP